MLCDGCAALLLLLLFMRHICFYNLYVRLSVLSNNAIRTSVQYKEFIAWWLQV